MAVVRIATGDRCSLPYTKLLDGMPSTLAHLQTSVVCIVLHGNRIDGRSYVMTDSNKMGAKEQEILMEHRS